MCNSLCSRAVICAASRGVWLLRLAFATVLSGVLAGEAFGERAGQIRMLANAMPFPGRLVDVIDATAPGQGFKDDGTSRVLDLASGRFRVTGAAQGFELSWFSYEIRTADRAGMPHLLVAELSNDRARYTTLTLTAPRKEPWSPPYTGQERVRVDAMQLSQEPLWFEPDIGLNIYTGGDLPVDGKPFLVRLIFYPKTAVMKLTVSSSGWDRPPAPKASRRSRWICCVNMATTRGFSRMIKVLLCSG